MTGRPIRVARVITRLNVGGPAIQALSLTERLDRARFTSILICGRPGPREGDMTVLRPAVGVAPLIIPELRREVAPISDIRAFVRLVSIFREFRPDVVHTHMAKAGALGRLAARTTGVPVVIHTFHGNVLRGYFGGLRSRAFAAIERALARMSTRVVAISPSQQRQLIDMGIAQPAHIVEIPLGLDLAPFLETTSGRLRAELGGTARPLVGIVARLVPIKRIDVFIDAAAMLVRRGSAALFVVVGDGDLRGELERRAADLGLRDRIRFLGWRGDLPEVYADLDVVVLTSDNEGTPVSVIEALAAGRAVVATEVGGVGDVIDGPDVGVLVPHDDAGAVASAIGRLLADDELRRRLGASGRARAYPRYDVAGLVDSIDELYSRLVERSGPDNARTL